VARAQNTFPHGMVDATAALWLPSLMRTIMRDAPRIKIRMMPLTTRDPRAMLLRGDVDLAVGFSPASPRNWPMARAWPRPRSVMSVYIPANMCA